MGLKHGLFVAARFARRDRTGQPSAHRSKIVSPRVAPNPHRWPPWATISVALVGLWWILGITFEGVSGVEVDPLTDYGGYEVLHMSDTYEERLSARKALFGEKPRVLAQKLLVERGLDNGERMVRFFPMALVVSWLVARALSKAQETEAPIDDHP